MSVGSFVKEPLLHFAILGALVFAVDLYVREEENNPHVVKVDQSIRTELTRLFEKSIGRKPKPSEYEVLVQGWLVEEIMFREAKLLGLDRGDEVLRSRLESKMRSMIVNAVEADDPTEADLKTWFVDNKKKYNRPALYDFQQLIIKGDGGKDKAYQMAEALNAQIKKTGQLESKPRSFKGLSRSDVANAFGEEYADNLAKAQVNKWQTAKSKNQWHLIRLEKKTIAKEAHFDEVKDILKRDWIKAENRRLAKEAFDDIRSNYDILREDEQ